MRQAHPVTATFLVSPRHGAPLEGASRLRQWGAVPTSRRARSRVGLADSGVSAYSGGAGNEGQPGAIGGDQTAGQARERVAGRVDYPDLRKQEVDRW